MMRAVEPYKWSRGQSKEPVEMLTKISETIKHKFHSERAEEERNAAKSRRKKKTANEKLRNTGIQLRPRGK